MVRKENKEFLNKPKEVLLFQGFTNPYVEAVSGFRHTFDINWLGFEIKLCLIMSIMLPLHLCSRK